MKKLKKIDFPADNYYTKEYEKKQIVLHHTASGPGQYGDIAQFKKGHINTPYIVARDGTINELYDPACWAFHLGVGLSSNRIPREYRANGRKYDQHSIGIEFDSWGYLEYLPEEEKFQPWLGSSRVEFDDAIQYKEKFRGHEFYERYTIDQLEAVFYELLPYLSKRFDIPVEYHGDEFDICERALKFEKGVFTHCSYVTANLRSDIHPDPRLIATWQKYNP